IADVTDIGQHLFVHQLRDALDQRGAVHAVRNFRDDDLLAAAFEFFDAGLTAHFHAAPAGLEVLPNSTYAADDAAGRKIRSFHMLHQLVERDLRVIDLCADTVDHFG